LNSWLFFLGAERRRMLSHSRENMPDLGQDERALLNHWRRVRSRCASTSYIT
jgi:hypothetical protein